MDDCWKFSVEPLFIVHPHSSFISCSWRCGQPSFSIQYSQSRRVTATRNGLGFSVSPYMQSIVGCFSTSKWHWCVRSAVKRKSCILDSSSPIHLLFPMEKIKTLLVMSLLSSPSSSRKRSGLKISGLSHFLGSWFRDHWLMKITVSLGMGYPLMEVSAVVQWGIVTGIKLLNRIIS